MTKKQILVRMLRNLKGVYSRTGDHARMLGAIERVLLIDPDSLAELRDRGLVYLALSRYAQAQTDFEVYLRRFPQAEDAAEIKEKLRQALQRQATLN